jgi:hypothetical protein
MFILLTHFNFTITKLSDICVISMLQYRKFAHALHKSKFIVYHIHKQTKQKRKINGNSNVFEYFGYS